MKSINSTLLEYLNQETSFASCDLYTLRLADGKVFYYANYDRDVVIDGIRYSHTPFMFKRDSIKLQGAPNVDSLSISVYCLPEDKVAGKSFMKLVHDGGLENSMLVLSRAYFGDIGCIGAFQLFSGRCEVSSAGGLTVKLTVKSVLQGLAGLIPPRIFASQAAYTAVNGSIVTSSTDVTSMLIPLKPSSNVLLQV